jgi:hypothetical protein
MKNENNVCFEEEVFLEETGKSYIYIFSNNPSEIQKAIEKKTGYLIPVNDTEWRMIQKNHLIIYSDQNYLI